MITLSDIILSQRMKAVVDMVPPHSSNIADVGCDHAYVSIYLKLERNAEHIIAMDVRQGPIEIAKKNIDDYGLTGNIEVRLSDGLSKLAPGEADTIIIAGMGGLLIKDILTRGRDVLCADNPPMLVLQPQSDIHEVRRYLYSIGYHIENETMLNEEGKYYTVILAVPGVSCAYEDEEDFIYGRINIESQSDTLLKYLENEETIFNNILSELNNSQNDQAGEKRSRKEERIREIEKKIGINRAAYKRCMKNEMQRNNRMS